MIPVPKDILSLLGDEMSGKDIDEIIKTLVPVIKDSVLFMKGGLTSKDALKLLKIT